MNAKRLPDNKYWENRIQFEVRQSGQRVIIAQRKHPHLLHYSTIPTKHSTEWACSCREFIGRGTCRHEGLTEGLTLEEALVILEAL